MANFLWSETNTKKNSFRNEYLKIENKFLKNYKKKIICNKFFCTEKIKKYNTLKIDFTGNEMNKSELNKKIFFYHSPGDFFPKKLLSKLKNENFDIFSNSNINQKYIKHEKGKNFLKNKSIIISTPGLGIIKEVIRLKKIFFAIFKQRNNEYLNNYNKLKKYKIIYEKKYYDEDEVFHNILKLNTKQRDHDKSIFKIFKFNGEKTIYNYIANAK